MGKALYISLFVLSLLSVGCKSSATLASDTRGQTDYATQKKFEKVFFEANKQKVLNNKEKALELYNTALAINPKSHATMYQLASLNYKLNRYQEAVAFAQKAVATTPVYNHWYSGLLGEFYNKFGKYKESADVFAAMVNQEPEVRKNYTEAANQYYNAKQYDKSVAILKQMQTKFGVERESSTRLDFVYSAMGEKDKAVVEMEKLVEAFPANVQYKGYLSETYMKADKEEKAITTLEQIIEEDPAVGKAHFALYSIYDEKGKDRLAMAHLKEAFKYDDLRLPQKMQAVSKYLNLLKSDTSLRADLLEFGETLELNYPTNIEPYILQSDIHALLGDYSLARINIRKAIEIKPSEYQLWTKLLGANAQLDDVDQQIEDTDEALELFPNVVNLYVAQSYAYIERKEIKRGISIADEGLDVAIDKRDIMELTLCKALAYEKLEDYNKADRYYDEIIEINPYNATVLNNYAYSLANRKIELLKADSMITTALKLEPSNPYYLDTKAWILYAQGDYAQALKILNKCIAIDPNGKDYYEHAKACYEALGNKNMANEMQQKKMDKLDDE